MKSLKSGILPCLSLFFIVVGANAQRPLNLDQLLQVKMTDNTLHGNPGEKVAGSPYLNEAFVVGSVYSAEGKYPGVPMRYNIYEDQIEFKQKDQLFILDPKVLIKKIVLDGRTFVVESYEHKGKMRLGFFVVLDSGKVMLMSKNNVTFREQEPPKALESGPTPAKYTRAQDTYYYKIGSTAVVKFDNIKKMIAGLPDKQAELTEFAKREKISSKNEEELIKLVKYYNSL